MIREYFEVKYEVESLPINIEIANIVTAIAPNLGMVLMYSFTKLLLQKVKADSIPPPKKIEKAKIQNLYDVKMEVYFLIENSLMFLCSKYFWKVIKIPINIEMKATILNSALHEIPIVKISPKIDKKPH